MQADFKLAAGVFVMDLRGIAEGYSEEDTGQGYTQITVNVSSDRLTPMFLRLARLVRTPGFAVVEIPTSEQEEARLRKAPGGSLHKDVYYLDSISFGRFETLYFDNEPFFVDDGAMTYGFGSHLGYDEVFVGRYKIMKIYTDEPEKYIRELRAAGYEHRMPLRTVRDNITLQFPGFTQIIQVEGKTIYDLIAKLQRVGFYFAEHRES